MIDTYLESTRALFNLPQNPMIEVYEKQFEAYLRFLNSIHPEIKIPSVKIVHSLNRLSETFSFQNQDFIVHDQYLGQSFNKMNRILYFESSEESFAYLCKILGEENYLINNISKSIAYTIYYHTHKNEKTSQLPADFIRLKDIIVTIQESFVFLHEFSHAIVMKDRNQLKFAEELLLSDELGISLINTVKEFIKSKEVDPNKLEYFYEEVACDFLAVNFTYGIFHERQDINSSDIFKAITSAFLFLRTLYDLKNKVVGKEADIFTLFMKLRYNALRKYITRMFSQTGIDLDSLISVYQLWEEKFDMLVVSDLTNEFENKLVSILRNGPKMNDMKLARTLIGINH